MDDGQGRAGAVNDLKLPPPRDISRIVTRCLDRLRESDMPEPITAIAGAIIAAANFITGIFSKRKELEAAELKELLSPLHEKFLTIHTNYVRMFNGLANNIRALQGHVISENLDSAQIDARRSKVVDEFYNIRKDIEGARDLFRAQIGGMLRKSHDETLRNYLTAIAGYVVEGEDSLRTKEPGAIEILKSQIVEGLPDGDKRAGDRVFDTPSMKLVREIRDASDLSEMERLVDRAVAGLAFKLNPIIDYYYELRLKFH